MSTCEDPVFIAVLRSQNYCFSAPTSPLSIISAPATLYIARGRYSSKFQQWRRYSIWSLDQPPHKSYQRFGCSCCQVLRNFYWSCTLLQMEWICSKVSKSIFFLRSVKNFLPAAALKSIYFSIIHSHFVYGNQIWNMELHKPKQP